MSKKRISMWPFLVALGIWAAWGFHGWLYPERLGELPDLEVRAQWGDTFGALNALFSAAAFIAVLLTMQSQQRQILDAEKLQQKQSFERTFYELLKLLREERQGLVFTPIANPNSRTKPSNSRGRNAIRAAVRSYSLAARRSLDTATCTHQQAAELYKICVHNRYESSLGPYFRLNYTLLYRIKTEPSLDPKEREMYGNLFRSQLTSYEVLLFGLNGLAPFSKDFGELITEYRIMKYAKAGRTLSLLKRCYPPKAFEARSDEGEG